MKKDMDNFFRMDEEVAGKAIIQNESEDELLVVFLGLMG
jgi:hypothetical protein